MQYVSSSGHVTQHWVLDVNLHNEFVFWNLLYIVEMNYPQNGKNNSYAGDSM